MAIKHLAILDMVQLEIINLVLEKVAGNKAAPTEGNFYYNTTAGVKSPQWFDGTTHQIAAHPTSVNTVAETIGATMVIGTSIEASRQDHVHAMPGLATAGVDGFMPGTDKTKLNAAASLATVSTLVVRDAAGRAQMVDPSVSADIATKNYVDTRTVNNIAAPTADWSMNSHKITGVIDPTNAQDAATKNYVDNAVQGLDIKASVIAATTAALAIIGRTSSTLTLGGTTFTLDTVSLSNGDRVLVKDSTTGTGAGTWDNGLYVVSGVGTSVLLTRATDADVWTELPSAFVFIEKGATLSDSGWVCTADPGGTLGTTAITFAQFSGSGSWTSANDPGVTGTGVYDNTTGSQFRFRGIKANSTKIAVALSTKDITIDVTESNLTHDNIGGTLGAPKGGTGQATYAIGDLLQASATNALARLAAVATGNVLLSGGVGVASAWGKVGLTTHITGSLAPANGGTGKNTWTVGSMPWASATTTIAEIAPNSTATVKVLTQASSGAPAWQAISAITSGRKLVTGSAASTSTVCTHNFGTSDVVVSIREASGGAQVYADVVITDANVVTVTFAVAATANQYYITVMG